MHARNVLVALLVCVAATGASARASTAGVATRLHLDWRHDRLSLDSAGAPLIKVLAETARRTGLRVEGAGPRNQNVDAHFADLPIREALARILSGVNFAIVEPPRSRAGAGQLTLFLLGNSASRLPGQRPSSTDNSNRANTDEPLGQLYQAAQRGDFARLKQAASAKNTDSTQAVALDLLTQRDPGAAANVALAAAASPDLAQRVTGLDTLGRIDGPAAVSALAAALNDPDIGIRQTALAALARQSSPEATRLLQQAAEDPDPSIRQFAKSLLSARSGQNLPTEVRP